MHPPETDVSTSPEVVNERRSRKRYPVRLPLHGWIAGLSDRIIRGETVNMSSNGILFTAPVTIPKDSHVHLLVQWPFSLSRGKSVGVKRIGVGVEKPKGVNCSPLSKLRDTDDQCSCGLTPALWVH
jgi:hypothetical protein